MGIKLGNTGLAIVISSIILLGLSFSPVFAQPTISFDQDPMVIEHGSVITVVDTLTQNTTITVQVWRGTDPQNPDEEIWVDLSEVDDTGVFTSVFVLFTAGPSDDGISPKLNVNVGSQVKATYSGQTTTATIAGDLPLSQQADKFDDKKTFRTLRSCDRGHGGDTDEDGICDNWEDADGLRVDYPVAGAYFLPCTTDCPSTEVKDIYLEINWMRGHKPNQDAIDQVITAFEEALAIGGTGGWKLHVFVDEEVVEHFEGLEVPGTNSVPGLDQIKAVSFGTQADIDQGNDMTAGSGNGWKGKAHVFYYSLWVHSQANFPASSGIAEGGGNDSVVSLGPFAGAVGSNDQQGGTLMHELGHNMRLGHGGDIFNDDNCKPNLLSVMSYSRQFSDLVPDRMLDYSQHAVGSEIPGSTSLGMENALVDDDGIGSYLINGQAQEQHFVYGIGNGQIISPPLLTGITTVDWPADWTHTRWIEDSEGKTVCAQPTTAVDLSSSNQWEEINLVLKNSHWREGRSADPGGANPTVQSYEPPVTIFSVFAEHIEAEVMNAPGSSVPGCEETNECFIPHTVTIDVEGMVTWMNDDTAAHTATSGSAVDGPDGVFDSSLVIAGDSFSHTFDEVGEYPYFCMVHPWMTGLVIVQEAGGVTEEEDFEFDLGDKWCLSEKEAKIQAKEKGSDINNAPLCTPDEITFENVRAARSVNVDSLKREIAGLPDTSFTSPDVKSKYNTMLETIRSHIYNDEIPEAIDEYKKLLMTYDGGDDDLIINEEAKKKIREIHNTNVAGLLKAVPEFEVIAMLVLLAAMAPIVAFTRLKQNLIKSY